MPLFYIGQPVICVNDQLFRGVVRRYPGLTWPRAGGRYVVRSMMDSNTPNLGWLTFITVQEIRNRKIRWPSGVMAEAGFWEERFEPATDIGDLEEVRKSVEKFMDGSAPVIVPRRRRQKEDS
jgi:hypothetical protein